MTFFHVDDGFYSHPKVLTIPRGLTRVEAVGTWTLTGAWSNDKLTDGRIPAHMVEELGGTLAGADLLVKVGLWRKVRGEYRFVNWEQWQSTREQAEANREAERVRKATYRQGKKRPTGPTDPSEPVPPDRQPVPQPSGSVPPGQVRTEAGRTEGRQGVSQPSPPPPTPLPVDRPSSQSSYVPDRASSGRRPESNLGRIRAALLRHTGRDVNDTAARMVLGAVLQKADRAGTTPIDATAYAARAVETEPFVWAQFLDENTPLEPATTALCDHGAPVDGHCTSCEDDAVRALADAGFTA